MMRTAKSDCFRRKINASKVTDPKAGWKLINSLTGRGNKSSPVNDILVNDRIVSDDEDISESFNDFLVNIGPTLAAESTKRSFNNVNTYLSNDQNNFPPFRFSNIPVENVALTLKCLKVSKSTGLDKIPAKVLKIASSIIAPSLTFIFNLSLSSGIFIDDWKNARVCPVYKGNDRRDMGNYRPISILPIISKVFEKEVFQQLYHYLKVNSILSKFQSGFRPLHSTVSALIQMCDDWSDNMDKGRVTGVVFLDIRKAFDSVDHSILIEKVQFYGVADRELMWFKSYLTARQQQCLVNGCLSSQSNLLCGVPQGSILAPLLFLIYINDLPNCLKFTTPCLYADDTKIFTSSFDSGVLANNINSDLKILSDWLIVNKLQFHPLKTKLMVVGSTYNLNTKSGELSNIISIDNNLVSRVPSNKCLGVLLDEKLTFETHIDYICKKTCAGIGALRRIKPFVPLCTLVTLYRSLFEPYFDYCSPLWDTCVKQLNDKLQKNQNRAGTVLTGSSYDVRSIDVLDNLKWKTLETSINLMYKILNDLSALQLSNSFVKLNATNVNYNLRNIETDLALPRPYTNFLKRSFRYSGAMLWNNLSYEAKTAQSLADFKHKLASSPSMPSA